MDVAGYAPTAPPPLAANSKSLNARPLLPSGSEVGDKAVLAAAKPSPSSVLLSSHPRAPR